MKKILSGIALLICFIGSTIAQAPQTLNYQAVARNSSGSVLQNQHIKTRFSIHDASINGAIVYQETDTATTNQFGLFTTTIGNGSIAVGSFTSIDWSTGNKYLEVELDPAGGNTFSSMGTTELVSVPYALYAQTANSVVNGFKHYVGQLYGGGIVITVWKDTSGIEHGLVASLTDISTNAPYSNVTALIGTSAEDAANGLGNTNAIIGQAGQTSSAAQLCHNYAGGGFNDWYLPSIWELQQCCNAGVIVNQILGNTNGLQFNNYWSSTETPGNNAWYLYFPDAYATSPSSGAKTNVGYVRAVRRY